MTFGFLSRKILDEDELHKIKESISEVSSNDKLAFPDECIAALCTEGDQ